ncbi:MAG: hypothetical protein JXR07_20260 [Reichenbachiella sp.]
MDKDPKMLSNVEINEKVAKAFIESYKQTLSKANEHIKIDGARVDVVLLSTSIAVLFFILSKDQAWQDAHVKNFLLTSCISFIVVIILNLFFLIESQKTNSKHAVKCAKCIQNLGLSEGHQYENLLAVLKQNAEIIKEDRVIDKRYGKIRYWIIMHNLYIQFSIWIVGIITAFLAFIL